MAIIDFLNILEDKLHYILLRYTQISEENASLKEELLKEKKNNEELISRMEGLEDEKKQFNLIRENVISKVEKLVYQLSIENGNLEGVLEDGEDLGKELVLDDAEAGKVLEDDLDAGSSTSNFLSSSTTINFLPDEGS